MTAYSENQHSVPLKELEGLRPVIVAVIGPTNEGKTSVLRTLTGDPDFGEVNTLTGTTARSEIQKVYYQSQTEILRLIDTPGFQISETILDLLEENLPEGERASFSIKTLLDVIPDSGDYRHDLRAWKSIDESDLLIYIVNAAESPNQSLQRDTLTLLSAVHKPLIAVFNKVADGDAKIESTVTSPKEVTLAEPRTRPELTEEGNGREDFASHRLPTFHYQNEWIQALRSRGFHLFQVYDAHCREFKNEIELLETIAVLVHDPLAKKVLRAEKNDRLDRECQRFEASRRVIARLMVDLVSLCEVSKKIPKREAKSRVAELEESLCKRIMTRELVAYNELLNIWKFRLGILDREIILSLENEKTQTDLRFGDKLTDDIKTGGKYGVGVGVATGLILDVALGGLSLGTGTAIGAFLGAAIGGCFGGFYNYHYDVKNERILLTPGKKALNDLLARSVELVQKLSHRGKALEDGIQIKISKPKRRTEAPEWLAAKRKNRKKTFTFSFREEDRQEWIDALTTELVRWLPNPKIDE